MNNTKTEAQRLADELVHEATKRVCNVAMMPYSLPIDAAKELRRLDAALDAELANRDVLDKMLTQCIAERDQLRAQLAKAVAEEREACAKVCEEFMRLTLDAQLGEPIDLHNVMLRQIANLGHGELAAAIRARSNT